MDKKRIIKGIAAAVAMVALFLSSGEGATAGSQLAWSAGCIMVALGAVAVYNKLDKEEA